MRLVTILSKTLGHLWLISCMCPTPDRKSTRLALTEPNTSRLPITSLLLNSFTSMEMLRAPYWMDGAADVAETTYTPFQTKPDAPPVRLIVRRVKPTPGSQLALFARYSYHAFITDRDGETLELEADHRCHAEVENAIRDLKYGVGLNHMPSGRFAANGAWLAGQEMAHNLARWTARIGLGERTVITKAAGLPSTPRPQAISPVAPSPTPFRCPHAVHRCPSVDSGLSQACVSG